MHTDILDVAKALDPHRDWDSAPGHAWSDFVTWPPDVFALTSVVMEETALHRFAASPLSSKGWPPSRDWYDALERVSNQWHFWARDQQAAEMTRMPPSVMNLTSKFVSLLSTPLSALADGSDWQAIASVLTLHHAADQACANVGLTPAETAFLREANRKLSKSGSLARLPTQRIRVLPKFRTPQVGITPRSLSLHAAIDRSELSVNCLLSPWICDEEAEHFNLLLLPWPLEIRPTAFKHVERKRQRVASARSNARYFEFKPRPQSLLGDLDDTICTAMREIGEVHAIVMPEGAIADEEIQPICEKLRELGVKVLLTGVRSASRNCALLAVDDGLGNWFQFRQDKHHRWRIDEHQIRTYHLGSALHPRWQWWESIDLPGRSANVLIANSWLTLCHLICEDLARAGPGADLVREIGPSLVIALLLDGPQLEARWPGRYASVLADDPGSSVLTLTALGMVERSRPPGLRASRTVALWKDQLTGARELDLAPDSTGIFLSLNVNWVKEYTADGRDDRGSAAQLVFGGAEQVYPKRSSPTRNLDEARRQAEPEGDGERRSDGAPGAPD